MKKVIKVEIIENFIKEQKLSYKDFCKKCDISYYILKKILSDNHNFGVNAILKVASFMNIPVSDLLIYNHVPVF